jgi:hypothetical protein
MFNKWFRVGLFGVLVGALLSGGWTLATLGGTEAAPPAVTRYDRVFGNIFYKVPAGYRAVQQRHGVVMVPQAALAAGDLHGVLLITPGFPLNAQLKAQMREHGKKTFVQALAIASGNLAEDPNTQLSDPHVANDPQKDGYEGYLLVSRSVDKDTETSRFAQYAIYLTGDRAEVVMRIGYGSQARLEALAPGFEALVRALGFRNAGAPPPARLAAALPGDLAAITSAPRSAPPPAQTAGASGQPRRSGGTCRVVQRQMCSGGVASGMGYFCNTYPQTVCN